MSAGQDPFAALGARPVDPFAALGARPVATSPSAMTPQDLAAEANRQFAAQGLPAASHVGVTASSAIPDLPHDPMPDYLAHHPVQRGLTNFSEGALNSLASAAKGLGDYVLGDKTRPTFDRAVQPIVDFTEPAPGVAGEIGKVAGAAAPFLIPGAQEEAASGRIGELLEKAPKAIRTVAKAVPKMATGAGITRIEGGNPLLGGALSGVGEVGTQLLNHAAPGVAESALGIRRADRAYGKTPGIAILQDTSGVHPATVAESARGRAGELTNEIEGMARQASEPRVVYQPPTQKALPGHAAVEPIPLHESAAPIERIGIAQPAGREVAQTTSLYGFRPVYRSATAMENVGPITSRTATEGEAAEAANEMANGAGRRASGVQPVASFEHPMTYPLNVVRRTEPTQGVLLRPVTPNAPITPEQAGFHLTNEHVSLAPARNAIKQRIAIAKRQNDETTAKTLQKVLSRLTTDIRTGEEIPENISPQRALELKRGAANMANYRGEPEFDRAVGSKAGKAAAREIDRELDRILGPDFASKNQRISSLIDVSKRAASAERGERLAGRVLHRIGAHTGALIGAASGGALGYERNGLPGLAVGSLLGGIAPELIASPTGKIAAARALNAAPTAERAVRPGILAIASRATATK